MLGQMRKIKALKCKLENSYICTFNVSHADAKLKDTHCPYSSIGGCSQSIVFNTHDIHLSLFTFISFTCTTKTGTSCLVCNANQRISVPEGLVDGSVPADEGHRGEEDEPKDGQTKVNTVLRVCSEVCQAGEHVEEESGTVDWGEVQETSDKWEIIEKHYYI